jgi:hypothetical protein
MKVGINNTKVPPRIMHLALLVAQRMGESAYDAHRVIHPHLPHYKTVKVYMRNLSSDTGIHYDSLLMGKIHAASPNFPQNALKCMALIEDEVIIIREVHYSVSQQRVLGFTDSISMHVLQEVSRI